MDKLTGDGGRIGEDLRYLGVHLDHELVLRDVLLVPDLHAGLRPCCERLANDGVKYVDRPLTRYTMAVLVVRKIMLDLGVML